LWEIETQAIQAVTWSTNGGRSPLGTKMQEGPRVAFKHAIQPDGSLLKENYRKKNRKQSDPTSSLTQERHAQKELDKTLLAKTRRFLAKIDIVVQDKMDGKPLIQAELKHQMGTQMAWWCFLNKTTPNIQNQGKHAKQRNNA
jgi:hypothetical protein